MARAGEKSGGVTAAHLRNPFGGDWVSRHTETWKALLAPLVGQPDVRFLEIGSHKGRSAVWWLKNVLTHDSARLVCVDPWRFMDRRLLENKALFDYNIDRYGFRHKVRVIQAESRRVLGEFPDDYFDAAYIDGSHTTYDALVDALLVLPLVKPQGVMIFDDYELEVANHKPVKVAVDCFLTLCGAEVQEIHRGWQIAVRKRIPASNEV